MKERGKRRSANQEIGDPGRGANREIGDPEIGGPGGWHSRGYLPHFDGDEVTQHVTFHLADSLPRQVVERMDVEIKSLPAKKQDAERRKRVEAWMDAGHGSCVLREPAVAAMVEGALLHFDGERYRLIAWVVMPNHVHVLFQPMAGWKMSKIVASWKKFTARAICDSRKTNPGNANLPIVAGDADLQIGPVWHPEYWDRFIRDGQHFQQVVEYIHQNPVKAGLVAKAEDWRWSSGSRKHQRANPEIGDPGREA